MSANIDTPKTLQSAILHYADEATCIQTLVAQRWPDGIVCPYCESREISALRCRPTWQCRTCRKEFSIKVGTFMEDSPIKLSKWFLAMWMIANCKNGVSSYEIHRAIGVTQKSAWFMMHRIRLAFGEQPTDLEGTVQADETYIGGLEKNKHYDKKLKAGRGTVGKEVVTAIMERKGRARTKHVANADRETLHAEITAHVKAGSTLHTDAHRGYRGLPGEYLHEFVDHAVAYVMNGVHTNGLENFFSLLKRMVRGTYVSIDAPHLKAYLDEQTFRFNERKDNDAGRFEKVIEGTYGKRLTYAQLTGDFQIF